MSPYAVARISADQIDPAYALVVHVVPGTSLEQWQDRCRAAIGMDRRGTGSESIFVVTNPPGYIQGLCVAVARHDPAHGRILDVPMWVIASAADERGVLLSLLEHLRRVAGAQLCGRIGLAAAGSESLAIALEENSDLLFVPCYD